MKWNFPYTATGNKTAHFCKLRRKYIIDNYTADNLPLVGWFKYCSCCERITSSNMNFLHHNSIVLIPLCRQCKFNLKCKKNLKTHCENEITGIRFQLKY